MPNWHESMEQTFEYWIVNPSTWMDQRQLRNVKSCTITRDGDADTLGSASLSTDEMVGECYIRVYLKTIQNGHTEKFPLGTFLVQTPQFQFNGVVKNTSLTCYTPLLELKENPPPLGYSILEGEQANILDRAYEIMDEHMRGPIVPGNCSEILTRDFVANTNDTWLTFCRDLIGKAKYRLDLDEYGRVLFAPKQPIETLQPVWTYNVDGESILQPQLSLTRDLYAIPNVVKVIYSTTGEYLEATAVNDDPNNVVSTVNRGREIIYREVNPSSLGNPTEMQLEDYAKRLLQAKSTITCTLTYTHGYCPVRLGDCVRLNYPAAGLTDVKAQVIRQSINCTPGCQVSETAAFTTRFWGGDL